jgi:hypothetical protein
MVHIPINHQLQPYYRTLSGLIGAYLVAFGITGAVRSHDLGPFQQTGLPSALGLHANFAFAILSIVVGGVLLIGALVGRNVDQRINLYGSVVFMGAGLFMLLLQRGRANFFGFTPATCVVSLVIGLALLLCGLYGKVGTRTDVHREEQFRHGRAEDPDPRHRFTAPNPHYDRTARPHRDDEAVANPPRDRERAA